MANCDNVKFQLWMGSIFPAHSSALGKAASAGCFHSGRRLWFWSAFWTVGERIRWHWSCKSPYGYPPDNGSNAKDFPIFAARTEAPPGTAGPISLPARPARFPLPLLIPPGTPVSGRPWTPCGVLRPHILLSYVSDEWRTTGPLCADKCCLSLPGTRSGHPHRQSGCPPRHGFAGRLTPTARN